MTSLPGNYIAFCKQITVLVFLSLLITPQARAQDEPAAESATAQVQPADTTELVPSSSDAATAEAAPAASDKSETTDKPAGEGAPAVDSSKSKAEPPEEIAFNIQPYTVRVEVGFHDACVGSADAEEIVLTDIRNAVALMYGAVWSAEIHRNSWMLPATMDRLRRLEAEQLLERYPEQEYQKAMLLSVQPVGSAFLVSCREYDARIQELTPVYQELTRDRRSIASIAARLMRDAFRPNVLFLRNIPNDEGRPLMELQVQAGAIRSPDPSAEQVVEGDILRTFTRQMERRDPSKVQMLRVYPLSYVRVLNVLREKQTVWVATEDDAGAEVAVPPFNDGEEPAAEEGVADGDSSGAPTVSNGLLTGIFLTHMRMSLFGAKGRRMQHLAVRQRPTSDMSRVRIVLQGRPDKPLVSHRLAIAYQLFWKDEEDGEQTQLVTDRNGEVVVHARENHPTFWIRVYSGTSLLARVPYAPGLLPHDVVELPDDSVRLGVEGEINLLADELVDAIALREVLMARANSAAKAGDGDAVKELLDIYETVPAKKTFLEKISNIRIPAINRATERRLGTRGIKDLCDGLESTVTRFFSDEKRISRQREIDDLKRAVQ